jgi:hypothetical protein
VFYEFPREYPVIYADDAALSAWLRLLMLADGVWPAPAVLPRSVKDEPLAALQTAGLVTLEADGDHFRILGLDKLRQQTHDDAVARANKRWAGNAGADAHGDAQASAHGDATKPNHTTPRSVHTEGSIPLLEEEESHEGRVPEHWNDLFSLMEQLTGKPYALPNPWSKMAVMALELIDRHGWEMFRSRAVTSVERLGQNPGVDEIIFAVNGMLRRSVDSADIKKAEKVAEIDDGVKRRVERTQLSLHYQHLDPAEHPLCPACRDVAV